MNFKIDTREKFTMITPVSDFSSDNLTAEFKELIHSYLQHKTNLVINLKNVVTAKENTVNELAAWQQQFYEQNLSFVNGQCSAALNGTGHRARRRALGQRYL